MSLAYIREFPRLFLLALALNMSEASRIATVTQLSGDTVMVPVTVIGRRLQGNIGSLSQTEFIVVVIASALCFLLLIALILMTVMFFSR